MNHYDLRHLVLSIAENAWAVNLWNLGNKSKQATPASFTSQHPARPDILSADKKLWGQDHKRMSCFRAWLSLILVIDSPYSLKTSRLSPTKHKGKSRVLYFLWKNTFNALNLCLSINKNENVFPKKFFLKFSHSFINWKLSEVKLQPQEMDLLTSYSDSDHTEEETLTASQPRRERLLT